jgi:hypothetical protein
MTLQGTATIRGRPTKFTPENIQKIKNWVAQGISREQIAKSLDVTVGSLQVTCSRLGISLRIPKIFDCTGDPRGRPVLSRPVANDPPMARPMQSESQYPRFQIVVEHNGITRRATDLPLSGRDIVQLGLEAAVQNLSIVQLMAEAVTTAIKKDMIGQILHAPPQEPAPRALSENIQILERRTMSPPGP